MRNKEVDADNIYLINALLDKGYRLYRAYIGKEDGKPKLLMISE